MRTLSLPRRHIAVRLWFVFLLFASTVAVAEAQQKPDDATPAFSETVVQQLLGTVRNGLVAHDPDKMLSAFGGMQDYNRFAEQVRTLFSLYENFRVYYRVLEVAANGAPDGSTEGAPRGRAVIEMQLQGDNTQNNVPGLTRTGQLHLSFERLRSGWRISDIDREFFH